MNVLCTFCTYVFVCVLNFSCVYVIFMYVYTGVHAYVVVNFTKRKPPDKYECNVTIVSMSECFFWFFLLVFITKSENGEKST